MKWLAASVRDVGEDFAEWIDASTGLPCRAVLNPTTGTWCGYVGVPLRHPWHGLEYDDLPDIDVHGGVTFTGEHRVGTYAGDAMGTTRAEGVTWWIGFDCAHAWDVMPLLDARSLLKLPDGEGLPRRTFKDLDYVRAECARLATQIVEARV